MSAMPAAGGVGPSVVVSFQLAQRDVADAERWSLLHSRMAIRTFVFGLVFVAVGTAGTIAASDPHRHTLAVLILVCGLYFLGWCALRLATVGDRSWSRQPGLREPQVHGFSPVGVWSQSPSGASQSTWALYCAATETDHAYLLTGRSKRGYLVVPKRALSGPAQELAFRHLLETFTYARFLPPRS